jgi:hypothetical protein
MPSGDAAKSCSTAACSQARKCSRRWRSERGVALIGKAFLYALAAMGEQGVTAALDIIRNELRVSLSSVGKTSLSEVDHGVLRL